MCRLLKNWYDDCWVQCCLCSSWWITCCVTTSCKLSDEGADDKRYAEILLSGVLFFFLQAFINHALQCRSYGHVHHGETRAGAPLVFCSSRLTRGARSDWETCEAFILGGAPVCSPDLQDCTLIAEHGETLTLPCVTRRKPWTTSICTKPRGDFEVAFSCERGAAAQPLRNYESTPHAITLQITRIGFPLCHRGRLEVL